MDDLTRMMLRGTELCTVRRDDDGNIHIILSEQASAAYRKRRALSEQAHRALTGGNDEKETKAAEGR